MARTYDEKNSSWRKIGLDFEPEDIHVMRIGESEEDFDRRIEQYTEDEGIG